MWTLIAIVGFYPSCVSLALDSLVRRAYFFLSLFSIFYFFGNNLRLVSDRICVSTVFVLAIYIKFDPSTMAVRAVLESEDIASLIAEYLDPTSIVALGRVSRDVRAALRTAIRGAPSLLVRAAGNTGALTKTQLMGFLALTSAEADALPRSQYVRLRGSGFYFLYRAAAFDQALANFLGTAEEWEGRLRARSTAATTLNGGGFVGRKHSPKWSHGRVNRCR